jgi:hypothetical protein
MIDSFRSDRQIPRMTGAMGSSCNGWLDPPLLVFPRIIFIGAGSSSIVNVSVTFARKPVLFNAVLAT